MKQALAHISLWILLTWIGFALLSFAISAKIALIAAAILAGLVVILFRKTLGLGALVALLEPIGIGLPFVTLWHIAGTFELTPNALAVPELITFICVYLVFLFSAFGVIRADLYRHGYAPLPVGAMVLILCIYGLITGNIFLPILGGLGQITWVLRWGSSNWFDHVLHLFLLPIAMIELIQRMF